MKQCKTRWLAFILALCMVLAVFVPMGTFLASAASTVSTPTITEEYRAELLALGFPESYIPMLAKLHEQHPTWTFTPYNITALDSNFTWDYVINQMLSVPNRNLVHADTIFQSYRHPTNTTTYDSGLYAASSATVQYFMDPRNFLNDYDCFMFLDWHYNGRTVTVEQVEAVLSGCAFGNTVIPDLDGTTTYAQYILQVGIELGVDPMFLAARLRDENGSGTSALVTGTVSGYAGYYNFFNVGASGSGSANILANGAAYAKNTGTPAMASVWGSASWNTRWKSIYGGAYFLKTKYVDGYKNTLYLQKFNVDPRASLLFSGYMQAVNAPLSQSKTFRSSLNSSGVMDAAYNFLIPVFSGMPGTPCTDPGGGNTAYYSYSVYPVTTYNLESGQIFDPTFSVDFTRASFAPATDFGLGTASNNNTSVGANTSNGYLTFTATGTDPYISIATDATAQMGSMDYVLIKYKTSSTAYGELFCDSGWARTVSWSWNSPYTTKDGWSFALINATSAWGTAEGQMINLRFDMLADPSSTATNFNGQSVDVAYIRFFPNYSSAVNYITNGTEGGSSTPSFYDHYTVTDMLFINGAAQCAQDADQHLASLNNTITEGTSDVTSIAVYGWTNTGAANIAAFGYELDGEANWSDAKGTYAPSSTSTITQANSTNNIAPSDGLTAYYPLAQRHLVEIPTAGLADGTHTIRILIKLTDGTINALTAWGTIYLVKGDSSTSTPDTGTTVWTNPQTCTDGFAIDGVWKTEALADVYLSSISNTVNDTTASMKALAFYGWVNTNANNIAAFGYEINGTQVWTATKQYSYTVDNGAGGTATITTANTTNNIAADYGLSASFPYGKRGLVEVDVGSLAAGTYTIKMLLKLDDGTVGVLTTWPTVTYVKAEPATPDPGVTDSLTGATAVFTNTSPVSNWRYAGQLLTINGIAVSADVGYRDPSTKTIHPAAFDGSILGGTTLTLSGWAMANAGQSKIVWSIDGTTWYDAPTITYASATEDQRNTAISYATLTSSGLTKGAFSGLTIDLSSLKGQTVNLRLAVIPSNSATSICHFATIEDLAIQDRVNQFTGTSVSLGSDLSITYHATVINGLPSAGQTLATRFTMNGASTIVAAVAGDSTGTYTFTFTGIAPQAMGDNISAELVLLNAQGTVTSVLAIKSSYSIKSNAQSLLSTYAGNTKMVTLLSDMLVYGAAAQTYTGYQTNQLVTAGVTGMTPSSGLPSATDSVASITVTTSPSGSAITAGNLYFSYCHQLQIAVRANSAVRLVVKKNGVTVDTHDLGASATVQVVSTAPLYSTELATGYTFELYENGSLVQTMTYSANSYLYNQSNKTDPSTGALTSMAEMARALYRYGVSCINYNS